MPTYKTSQEWLEQSSLLLQARPSTTRITTKYSMKPVKPRKSKKDADNDSSMTDAAKLESTSAVKPPRGSLEIKTFDPVSGVALKYRTTKAAEVSRLITTLGSLGQTMATSKAPEEMKDEPAATAPADENSAEPKQEKPQQSVGASGGGSGGKKKKKGKK
ncbi:Uncharacterized protein Cob_v008724 [Colletotrichum orbiculare MAFF 240422]|uniref:SRP9 domain-containing protein n=1 Tax=Colletotrichum orbiculare (strain 104-T / ATCC 96160 / CBS 514.97 / LARS 414 / MAFF 240422) TaxID=1213857 RepID=A0A484FJ54_COLOR|nr:Uncharacterized protein Cob_v008724 [Colletotrichum orbiculare MAFF 240422]